MKAIVAAAVEGRELADGVEQVHGICVVGDRRRVNGGGTAKDLEAGLSDEGGHGVEALGSARGEDEEGARRGEGLPAAEDDVFFALGRGAGDEDGPAAGGLRQPRRVGKGRRLGRVVLQVPGDADTLGRRAERDDALSIELALHGEDRDPREALREPCPHQRVPRERTRRDAAVDEGDRNPARRGALEKERPDFRFRQQNEAGPDGVEGLLHRAAQVEGKGEHRDVAFDERLGELAAGGRRHREPHRLRRRPLAEGAQDVARDSDFADGNGVDPGSAGEIRIARQSQPPAHVAEPPAPREGSEERVRRVQQQREGREEAIEEHSRIMTERRRAEISRVPGDPQRAAGATFASGFAI